MDIVLKWNNRSVGADGVRLYRSERPITGTPDFPPLAELGPDADEFTDPNLPFGEEYHYRVSSYLGDRELYSQEIKAAALPYSGPGPQRIKSGDLEVGFYGVLRPTEFINTPLLFEKLGLSFTIYEPMPRWFKYSHRGKTLYFPIHALANRMTWLELYEQGLVYGVEGPGPVSEDMGLEPVDQNRVVEHNGDYYQVRLMSGMADSSRPLRVETGIYEALRQDGSEWNDLVIRSFTDAGLVLLRQPYFDTGVSAQESVDSENPIFVQHSSFNHCQEIVMVGDSPRSTVRGGFRTTNELLIGHGAQVAPTAATISRINSTGTAQLCYRPVLELLT